jgi:hypothetical protein
MADFLTRLAGRALGLVPTVQPILAPMYAPGQQFVGAEDAQEMLLFERGAATGYPQAEVRGRAMSLQNRPADEPAFGELVGQIMDAREISFPLVPQGSQPSTTPTQTPHTPSRTLDEQPTADHSLSSGRDEVASSAGQARRTESTGQPAAYSLSLGRDEAASSADRVGRTESTRNASVSGLHPIHPTDAVIPLEARTVSIAAEQQRDSSLLPRTAREVLKAEELSSASALLLPLVPQGNRPVGTSHLLPVVDTLPTQRPAELKAIRPQQGTHQVAYPGYPYNRVNQHEAALTTQEPSTPAATIQVTIGRIEVRATPAATPRPQAARSAPSVMSLDDYLNQRARGGH